MVSGWQSHSRIPRLLQGTSSTTTYPKLHHSSLAPSCLMFISLWNGPTLRPRLIDWLRLANIRRPTREGANLGWRRQQSSIYSQLLPFTDYSRLDLYICSLPGGFLVRSGGGSSAGPWGSIPRSRLSIYRFLKSRTRLCKDFVIILGSFAVTTLRLWTRLGRVANSRWKLFS